MSAGSTGRPKLYSDYTGPGPAYVLKPLIGKRDHDVTKSEAPCYSMRYRIEDPANENPGPSAYTLSDKITAKGRQEVPTATIKGRTKIHRAADYTPGPGAYVMNSLDSLSTRRAAPAPTLGPRTKFPDYRCAPAPTAYSLPLNSTNGGLGDITKRKAPSWSFRSKAEFGSPHYEGASKSVPAPTIYRCPDPEVYLKQPGKFSIAARTKYPQYNTALRNPAPGAYEVGCLMGRKGQGFSMGLRHSERKMLFVHPFDVV